MLLNREEFLEELKDKIIVVNFTKVNGDKREMRCTLDPKILPPNDTVSSSVSKASDNRMNVWDVDAEGWRSFLIDRVNYVVLSDTRIQHAPAKEAESPMSLKDIILSPRVGS